MRLIDADALILALETQDYSCAPDTLEDWTPQDMTKAEIADINNAPTIEAEPVVHCKDCKHYTLHCTWNGEKRYWCEFDILHDGENGFCSCAERKDG